MELEDIDCHPCRTILRDKANDNWPRHEYGDLIPCTEDIIDEVNFQEVIGCGDSPIQNEQDAAQYLKTVIAER